jgi:hypothetical protein
VQKTRQVVLLLHLDVLLQAQDGDLNGALRSWRALLNTARSLGDEPMLLTQLVRMGEVETACELAERLLAQGEPTPDELVQMQRLLQEEERFPRLLIVMRGERACTHEVLDGLTSGDLDPRDWVGERGSGWGALSDISSRDNFRSQHPRVLTMHTEAVQIASLPVHQRVQPLAALESKLKGQTAGRIGTLVPATAAILNSADRRTIANLRCLITAVAAERYRRKDGRFPDTLEQLVPDFLPEVPLDPQNGDPLRYQRQADRVVIYSFCSGGTKSNMAADLDPVELSPPGAGIAIHLFDVKLRRQPPTELLPPPVPDDEPR